MPTLGLNGTIIKVLQELSVRQINTILAESAQGQIPVIGTQCLCTSCSGVDGTWMFEYTIERRSFTGWYASQKVYIQLSPDGLLVATQM